MSFVPKLDSAYAACIQDVLELYAELPDPARTGGCLDEAPVQLIGETG